MAMRTGGWWLAMGTTLALGCIQDAPTSDPTEDLGIDKHDATDVGTAFDSMPDGPASPDFEPVDHGTEGPRR